MFNLGYNVPRVTIRGRKSMFSRKIPAGGELINYNRKTLDAAAEKIQSIRNKIVEYIGMFSSYGSKISGGGYGYEFKFDADGRKAKLQKIVGDYLSSECKDESPREPNLWHLYFLLIHKPKMKKKKEDYRPYILGYIIAIKEKLDELLEPVVVKKHKKEVTIPLDENCQQIIESAIGSLMALLTDLIGKFKISSSSEEMALTAIMAYKVLEIREDGNVSFDLLYERMEECNAQKPKAFKGFYEDLYVLGKILEESKDYYEAVVEVYTKNYVPIQEISTEEADNSPRSPGTESPRAALR